ncbi:MAG: ABC transporter permease subunit [Anaerolineae bacterium]|jgi:ABC-type dipeptide/oligopeptide/nickel transport system permease subunit|nr:ABC transporter permease subunit [Anaerolineae bacterium]MBT7072662.1 ABC transporter permease subunit [Anaerolineae bacterium]MBT7324913.1 ABC transporter permease subunit [Anaerolineae bacterium]
MNWLMKLLKQILNPRANLDNMPALVSSAESQGEAPGGARGQLSWRDIFLNIPLMLGAVIVLALFIIVLFGPVWAPKNPYIAGQHIVPHFDQEKGEFIRPPLEPCEEFPLGTDRWGTDLLSLLLHGARNTLIASAFITMVRLILGVMLGGYAGWNEGKTVDRFIMSLVGVTTSIPMLISSMILIFALNIRKGLPTFIIALSVIGWTEIAQYIRSEFLVLRKMPFIEGAQSLGARGLHIAVRHVLPNILPQLLVLAFLEMGAVLMLLGELGFVGVYIGGGHQIAIVEMMAPTEIFTLAEVPEWGAMLADGYVWLRSKPFVVVPPAVAFFISIIGFTSLGEGLRRLVEKRSLNTAFLLKKRMLFIIVGLTLATIFIMNNTGAAPWFSKVAQAFNAEEAVSHIEALSAMDGRSVAQAGGQEAADYIQHQFEEYGLDPGWKRLSYTYPLETRIVQPIEQPVFALVNETGSVIESFQHQIDFGFVIEGHGGSGDAEFPLTFIGFDGADAPAWDDYQGLDLQDRIVLLQRGNAPEDFATEAFLHGARGVLWITGDGRDDVRSQIQWADPESDYQKMPNIPIYRIRPGVAASILKQAEVTWEALMSGTTSIDQRGEGWFASDLDVTIHMSLDLAEPEDVEIPSVMGYRTGSDLDIASELVVLFVNYDGLGTDPDGTVFPAANHNASGVGMLLEIARLWDEQELDTRRSVLFVAWGGAQLDNDGAREFLEDQFNFRHLITSNPNDRVVPALLLQLDYIGAGGDDLLIHPDSSPELIALFEETAQEFETPVRLDEETSEFTNDVVTRRFPWISLRWADADILPTEDLFENIDDEKIQSLGETLSLALTKIVRETDY